MTTPHGRLAGSAAPEGTSAGRLAGFLAAVEPHRRATVRSCVPVVGGFSRTTEFADVEWDDGTLEQLVLRADPAPGTSVFTSDRGAEWRLVTALARSPQPGFAVARPRWFDATGAQLGTPCIVSDRVPAPTLQQVAGEPPGSDAYAQVFVETVAAVHAVPLAALPAELERPADLGAYLDAVADDLDRARHRTRDSAPVLALVAALLRRYRPAPVPFTLVHGDCQTGNVLLPADGPPVVIDWEFARIGDPRADLGYFGQVPFGPRFSQRDPEGFLARYRELTGLSQEQVNPQVVGVFLVVGMATLLVQLLDAVDAVGRGERRGALAPYLLSAVSLQYDLFTEVAARVLEA